jgi:acetyl esterase/lipase
MNRRTNRTLFAAFLALPLLVGLAGGPARAEPHEAARSFEVQAFEDLPYIEGKDAHPVRHKLDLFVPKGQKDFPTLFLVHGGIWMAGDKSYHGKYTAVARFFASQGIATVSPNYRLSPLVRHPEHVKDVARAFAWTHQNIARYGGRPDQLFVAGHSAGGHLAALLAMNENYLKPHGLDQRAICGVIGVSGVYRIPDVPVRVGGRWEIGNWFLEIEDRDLQLAPLRLVFGSDSAARKEASPITYVRPGLPPFLIITGDLELPIIKPNAREFADALKEARCDVQALEVPRRNHFSIMFAATNGDDPVAKAMLAFIHKHLQAQASR